MSDLEIPRTVEVLGQPFRVEVITRDESLFRGAPEAATGSTDLNRQLIRIRSAEDLSLSAAVETLLHEVLHAVIGVYSFYPYLEGHDDEAFVAAFAPALLHTLRENPVLVAALQTRFRQEWSQEAGDGYDTADDVPGLGSQVVVRTQEGDPGREEGTEDREPDEG